MLPIQFWRISSSAIISADLRAGATSRKNVSQTLSATAVQDFVIPSHSGFFANNVSYVDADISIVVTSPLIE